MILMVNIMVKNVQDNFDNLIEYKLYRNVRDLIHPSISKRNISDYRIILNDVLLPVRVFYPKKVSNMQKVIIYIPGEGKVTDSYGKYTAISKDLALKTNRCLITVDYFENGIKFPDTIDKIYELLLYLYQQLHEIGIADEDIVLLGDSFGGNLVNAINIKFIEDGYDYIKKCVLFYPMISMNYEEDLYPSFEDNTKFDLLTMNTCKSFMKNYTNSDDSLVKVLNYDKLDKFPRFMVITGDIDPLRDEGKDFFDHLNKEDNVYCNLESNTHGFLKYIHTMKDDIYNEMNKFMNGDD
jgi:acetyl esterase/lipase